MSTWLFQQKFDHFVCFESLWAESALSPAEKKWHFGFVVAKMSSFKFYYLWLKKSITKINAFLAFSEVMASFEKVLRSFGDIVDKFTWGSYWTEIASLKLGNLGCCWAIDLSPGLFPKSGTSLATYFLLRSQFRCSSSFSSTLSLAMSLYVQG